MSDQTFSPKVSYPTKDAEEPIGCVPILTPASHSHGLYVVAVCLAHGYKEPESLPCPLCERATREQAEAGVDRQILTIREQNKCLEAQRQRAEQAEARLVEAIGVIKEVQEMFESETWQCPRCGHAEPTRDCNSHYVTREFLASTTPPPILAELQETRAECAAILGALKWTGDGYEWNGHEFSPTHGDYREAPQNAIARGARALTAELERWRRLEKHHNAKWLDPECHNGCQSLVFKNQRDALKLKLEVAKEALQGIVDHCIHPDVAVRAVMVDLKPIREAISKLNAP